MDNFLQILKSFQKIQPTAEWKEKQRVLLMAKIQEQTSQASQTSEVSPAVFTTGFYTLFLQRAKHAVVLLLPSYQYRALMKPMAVLLIFVMGFGGGITMVSASQDSLPGDVLYSVKLVAEQTQLSLTPTDGAKTKLKVDFVGKRAAELKEIVKKPTPAPVKKAQVKNASQTIKKDLQAIQNKLDDLKKTNPQQVAEVAKAVEAKTNTVQEVLTETKENVAESLTAPSMAGTKEEIKETKAAVASALTAAEATNTKALEVMIEKQKETSTSPDTQIIAKVEEKIVKAKSEIAAVVEKTNEMVSATSSAAVAPSAPDKKDVQPTTASEAAKPVLETMTQAKVNLDQAKELLEQKDLGAALDKVKESKELVKKADEKVEATKEVIAEQAKAAAPEKKTESAPAISGELPKKVEPTATTTTSGPTATSTAPAATSSLPIVDLKSKQ